MATTTKKRRNFFIIFWSTETKLTTKEHASSAEHPESSYIQAPE